MLSRIIEKLECLRAADPDCFLFGSHIHCYRLGPLIPGETLKSIERHYRISLPENYAEFLIEVGNGGAGPGYGIQRFGYLNSIAEAPSAEPKGPHRVIQKTRGCTLRSRIFMMWTERRLSLSTWRFLNR